MGRPKKKLYEDQLKEKYNGKIENLEPYVNLNTKILHRCNLHKHNFRSTPASVLGSKHGCPKCGEEAHKIKAKSRMAYTDEEYKQILYERFDGNIICLEEMQGMNHSILHKCLKHNFEYYTSPSSTLHASCGCRHCATEMTKEKTMTSFEEFNKKVIDYSDGKYEACEDYSGYSKMMHFRHILPNGDSHIFEMIPSSFFRGGKCYCENGHLNKLIVGVNDIASKRPEIVNWLHNKDDATKYPYTSKEKIHWNCPNCNALLYKTISDVYYKGLSCPFCSDGISYPNKLIYNILKEVESDLDFLDREYQPEWCNFTMSNGSQRNGKYDIYFEKDGKKYIVEMDGGFHFKEHNYSDLSVDEVQEIDKLKDKVAIEKGIIVIRIDCNYGSTNRFAYISNNIINSELKNIIDFSNVDLEECNKKSLGSLIMDAVNLWNAGYNTRQIIETLNIGQTTVREYLRQGVEAGLCDYTPEKGRRRSYYKPVYCEELDKEFYSLTEASKETGFDRKYIGLCCKGKRDFYGEINGTKLHWKYVDKKFGEVVKTA